MPEHFSTRHVQGSAAADANDAGRELRRAGIDTGSDGSSDTPSKGEEGSFR